MNGQKEPLVFAIWDGLVVYGEVCICVYLHLSMVVTSGPFKWSKICLSVWTFSLGWLVRAKLGKCITPLKSGWGKGKTQVCGPKSKQCCSHQSGQYPWLWNNRVTWRLVQELDVGLHSSSGYLGIVYVLGRKISFHLADTSERIRFRK